MDARSPRDGKAIEYLGTYDPFVSEKDARVSLKRERVDYWLGVGAQASPKVAVLLRKYGTGGTHLEAQAAALEKLQVTTKFVPQKVEIAEKKPEAPAAEEAAPAEGETAEAPAEAPAEEAAKEEGGE
ncbi:MAG: 30S ribosomal protein S16 [Blastopirellula sp. JB062]